MGKITYVTGGARSGKSNFAEKFVNSSGKKKIYIATAIAFDEEMKARIAKHQKDRGDNWETIEGYRGLVEVLKGKDLRGNIILLDCLTNMVTNLMIMDRDVDWDNLSSEAVNEIEAEVKEEVSKFLSFVKECDADMVVVSNELGMGLVPTYPLGRHFRDIAGRINQLTAALSEEAYFIVSGLPMRLK
jgi:adenosylcobinamide kinase/adenosylcobinamide-phosphate guanylyltransferase